MNQTIQHFFIGTLIAFTTSVLIICAVMAIASDVPMVSVELIWQSFILSTLCSLINLVYRSEKLKFIWQSIIGYFLTTTMIITCGLVFDWYSYGGNNFNKVYLIILSFLVYSLFYLFTWIIIWNITKAKQKALNDKLVEYKQKQ